MIVLLEPVRPKGFVSGGYRYQDEIGRWLQASGTGRQEAVEPAALAARAAHWRPAGAMVVIDGLFVDRAAVVPGCALLLHVLPERAAIAPWLAGCVGVIATGGTVARALASSRVPVVVVRPGLDDCFAPGPQRSADACRRVLSVGTLARHKGQREVVAALARDRDLARRCVFECVGFTTGEPDYVIELQRDAEQIALQLELPGVLPPRNVAERCRDADLFVSASRSESFGMAVAEAVACGVPVLAFAAGEIGSFVRDGQNGRLLPASAPFAAFGTALCGLLRDDLTRALMRRNPGRVAMQAWHEVATAFASACLGFAAPGR